MDSPFLLYIIAINILAYSLMWVDKVKSIYGWWRISERTLWMLAIAGGAGGIWLGMMRPLYHKAGKRSFRIGVPLMMLVWISGLSLIYL